VAFPSLCVKTTCCIVVQNLYEPDAEFIYIKPSYFAFRQDISYENGKIISAEETSAYGL